MVAIKDEPIVYLKMSLNHDISNILYYHPTFAAVKLNHYTFDFSSVKYSDKKKKELMKEEEQ